MKNYNLNISAPTDGRYSGLCEEINKIFSEHNLIKMRVKVEIEWFIFLSNQKSIESLPKFSESQTRKLRKIYQDFGSKESSSVKKIEDTTKHDVKAVEYFIKNKIKNNNLLNKYKEHIHICCTSEDINNIAYSLMIKEGRDLLIYQANILQRTMKSMGKKYKNIAMLSHTHGQPASPTTMGKEFINFYRRLDAQIDDLSNIEIKGKFNGATGNYSAHSVTYPKVNWPNTMRKFVNSLKLEFNSHTTQIEPHDYIADLCDKINHINSILIGFSQDVWAYISKNYFTQKNIKGEIGSSTMPHKINPINFENAEGNLGISNALLNHLATKLPVSRMQRDLSDSTVLRNQGVALGHSLLGIKNILNGLKRIQVDKIQMNIELDSHWEILAEAIQTVLRKNGKDDAYEKLKELTRGHSINQKTLRIFIESLDISKRDKKTLLSLTPHNYYGLATKLSRLK